VRAAAGDLAPAVAEMARRLADAVGSVGIVAPASHRERLEAALRAGGAGDAGAEVTGHLSGAIDLLGLRSIKGLEFDAVVVVDPAAILAERPDGGAGGLYTALTRSTRALAIVHDHDLPGALAASPDLRHTTPGDLAGAFAP
jgi:superfamily I DNA/RNA helicase